MLTQTQMSLPSKWLLFRLLLNPNYGFYGNEKEFGRATTEEKLWRDFQEIRPQPQLEGGYQGVHRGGAKSLMRKKWNGTKTQWRCESVFLVNFVYRRFLRSLRFSLTKKRLSCCRSWPGRMDWLCDDYDGYEDDFEDEDEDGLVV